MLPFRPPAILRRSAALLLALAAVGLARAADPGLTAQQILIGQNITLQGGKNAHGVATQQGAKLYLDEANAAGGVHGRKLVLRTLDDNNQGAVAESNARQLVKEGAFLLFGSIEGGPSTAVLKVAQEANVPFIGPMAGSPGLRRPHQPMVFPVRAEHRDEFRSLMTWAKSIGLRSVGFLHTDSTTGREHLENVKPMAQELGLDLVLALPFKGDANAAQIDALVQQVATAKPDMMFNHGSPDFYVSS